MKNEEPDKRAEENDPQVGNDIQLLSLAPAYAGEQHELYVKHLKAAFTDRDNKNIALSGPYGSGKSSALGLFLRDLDERKRENEKTKRSRARWRPVFRSDSRGSQTLGRTLSISISTLGSDKNDRDITNRIQKELVKHLLYRADPGTVKRSTFARRPEPRMQDFFWESVSYAFILVSLLWMFGIRPSLVVPDPGGPWWAVPSFLVMLALTIAAVWIVRGYIGRRPITQVAAGGTSITIDKVSDSVFDRYLDEIVAFFDATEIDVVAFEDLDRFEDPRIFDSLRELNTLINASAGWRGRHEPLRFIYAIKDSLFEKLAKEPPKENDGDTANTDAEKQRHEGRQRDPAAVSDLAAQDAAEREVERANRTKFFEIVIPVVPFLTHSNARDVLTTRMAKLDLPEGEEVSRDLINLVARHVTDMRLLINIRNEFVVFAQKLLWVRKRTPGLEANHLFALVAYKNFHLGDFEKLPHRKSALDELEKSRRRVVSESIKQLQDERAGSLRGEYLLARQEETARELGERLQAWASASGRPIGSLRAGDEPPRAVEALHSPAFWRDVAMTGKLSFSLGSNFSFSRDQIQTSFPEALVARRWDDVDENLASRMNDLNERVARLRGADFANLVSETPVDGVTTSFAQAVNTSLASGLARDLVRQGYLNRYYAENVSVFYANYAGVDVANFFRNSVLPNEIDVQYRFTTEDAVRNILREAPTDFVRSRSALNIDVVDYLLEHERGLTDELVDFLVTEAGEDRHEFLESFLNFPGSRSERLIECLAGHPWSTVFNYLVLPAAAPDEDTQRHFFDTALERALYKQFDDYALGDDARKFIRENYEYLSVFRSVNGPDHIKVLMDFIRGIGLTVASLEVLSDGLGEAVLSAQAYDLTVHNLRSALALRDDEPINLDAVRKNDDLWRRCCDEIDGYLELVRSDENTPQAIRSIEVLVDAVQHERREWTFEQFEAVLDASSSDAALPDITKVDQEAWPGVIRAGLMVPSASNLLASTQEKPVGTVLAAFLENVETLENVNELSENERYPLALRLLNAESMKPPTSVKFTQQLGVRRDEVAIADLEPCNNNLLALLLKAGLVDDDRAAFQHFIDGAGWPAVSKAFAVSRNVPKFMDADLVNGYVAELLYDVNVSDDLKSTVIDNLAEYVPDDDQSALHAAGEYAHRKRIPLQPDQIERLVDAGSDADHVLWQLHEQRIELTDDQVIAALVALGGELAGFASDSGHTFEITTNQKLYRVLDRLVRSKRVEKEKVADRRWRVKIVR